jgi:hypothetical protein
MMEICPNAGAAKVEAANRGASNHFNFIVLLRVWSQAQAWTVSAFRDVIAKRPVEKTERISGLCRKVSFHFARNAIFHVHTFIRCKLLAKQYIALANESRAIELMTRLLCALRGVTPAVEC